MAQSIRRKTLQLVFSSFANFKKISPCHLQVQALRKYTKVFEIQGIHAQSTREELTSAVIRHWNNSVSHVGALNLYIHPLSLLFLTLFPFTYAECHWRKRTTESPASARSIKRKKYPTPPLPPPPLLYIVNFFYRVVLIPTSFVRILVPEYPLFLFFSLCTSNLLFS